MIEALMTWGGSVFVEPANTIALAAVFVSLVSAWSSWQHGRLSVLPAFAAWADYPTEDEPQCSIRLSNKGFGPALIQSFDVWHGDYRMAGEHHLRVREVIERAFGVYGLEIHRVASVDRGHAFGSGDSIVMADFSVHVALAMCGDDHVAAILQPISLTIRYQDIYRRRWVFTVHEFAGYTYRRSYLNPRYLFAKYWLGHKV